MFRSETPKIMVIQIISYNMPFRINFENRLFLSGYFQNLFITSCARYFVLRVLVRLMNILTFVRLIKNKKEIIWSLVYKTNCYFIYKRPYNFFRVAIKGMN